MNYRTKTPNNRPWRMAYVIAALVGGILLLAASGYGLTIVGRALINGDGGALSWLAALALLALGWILIELAGSAIFEMIAAPFIWVYRRFSPEPMHIGNAPARTSALRLATIFGVGAVVIALVALLL